MTVDLAESDAVRVTRYRVQSASGRGVQRGFARSERARENFCVPEFRAHACELELRPICARRPELEQAGYEAARNDRTGKGLRFLQVRYPSDGRRWIQHRRPARERRPRLFGEVDDERRTVLHGLPI